MGVRRLTSGTLPVFKARFDAIPPGATPRFGRLTPAGLFKHLQTILEMSLGRSSHPDISNWFSRNLLKPLVFRVFTRWPGGKLKAPDSFTPAPEGDHTAEKARLFALMDDFTRMSEENPHLKTNHALFGPVALGYWQRMHGVHFEHHFRQFGV